VRAVSAPYSDGVSALISTPTLSAAQGIPERFHPAVRAWFERRFADGPTEAQAGGWPPIAAGEHTLICAPAIDPERWLAGMRRIVRQARETG
jgi:hypothetical protein